MDPHAELRWLSDLNHQLWRDAEAAGGGLPPLAARLAIAEREVAVYEQIAAGQKRRSSAVRDGLEYARRIVAQLRSEQAAATAAAATDAVQGNPLHSKETRP